MTPEDIEVLRYTRLRSAGGEGGITFHLFLVRNGTLPMFLELIFGSGLSVNVKATGGRAATAFDLAVENEVKGVEGVGRSGVETTRFDAVGQKAFRVFFGPMTGIDWEKYTEAEGDEGDAALEDFHRILTKQVNDWKGGRSGLEVTKHRYWPTFKAMVGDAVRAKFGSSLKLYRGVWGSYAYEILRGDPIKILRYSSWSYSKDFARNFVSVRKDYWLVIGTAQYKVDDVVFAPVDLPDYKPNPNILHNFATEREIVVQDDRGMLPASSYKIVSQTRKKMAERVMARYLSRPV